ncbi:MAG: EscU/YscU/HrcU family type III secretion system export apparatus switch protein, partial [Deltaproteobacteria bacterium]|nr:EscU/YscU/HrcU family type III secretion system export apparatus switch protein [Deltaproteobacteria bacterium]
MPEDNFQDKTEPATPKKKEEARKKGEVAKSRELSTIVVLSAGVLYLFFAGKHLVLELGNQIRGFISNIPQFKADHFDFLSILHTTAENVLWLIMPMMLILCVVAILGNFLQTGLIWS